MGEWRDTTLDECAAFQEGYVNPPQGVASHFDGPIKWLRAVDLNDGEVWDTSRSLSETGYRSAGKAAQLFLPGTLAISKSGTIGRLGLLKAPMCGNRAVINIRPDASKCNPRFIFYALKLGRAQIEILAEGSVQKNLYVSALSQFRFRLPPLAEQNAITSVLSSLDDKIELNRRMSETLEAMALAIFRDWFVDFGPVRRKLAGETDPVAIMGGLTPDPARATVLAALFPEGLDENDLPLGWTERRLDDITLSIRRGIAPKYNVEGGAVVINQKCIREGRVSIGPARRHDHGLRSIEGRKLEPGDVLVNSTGVGTLGRLAQIWEIEEPTVADSHITVVRADPAHVSAIFLGVAMRPREPEIVALGEGSTGQTELSRALLGQMKFVVPGRMLMTAFDELCGPMIERIRSSMREQRTLAETRNYLLPRLMSGQVRVGDVGLEVTQ